MNMLPRWLRLSMIVTLVPLMLVACRSLPKYDTPPDAPVNMAPAVNAELRAGVNAEFVWQASDQATWYDFHIFNRQNGDIKKYYERRIEAGNICSEGLCRIQRIIVLPEMEGHAWRVRAGNPAGWSGWSRSTFNFVR